MTVKKPRPKTKAKGNPPKKSTGRKCSICNHAKVSQINTAIAQGESFRNLAAQYKINESSACRHSNNCLGAEIGSIIKEQKTGQAVDVIEQFRALLAKGLEGLQAASDLLTVDGKMNFSPRAWEVEVVCETMKDGAATQFTKPLSELLDEINDSNPNFSIKNTFTKVQDNRKTYFEAIKTTEGLVSQFAKLGGLYQQDKPNDTEFTRVYNLIKEQAKQKGISVSEEAAEFLRVAKQVDAPMPLRQKIERELISEAVN